jgi:hypothetical protein
MARSRGWLTDLPFRPSAKTPVSDEAGQLGSRVCQMAAELEGVIVSEVRGALDGGGR